MTPPMSVVRCEKCGTVGNIFMNDASRASGSVYRRRECKACGHRWSSQEVRASADQVVLVVPKNMVKVLQTQMLAMMETLEQLHVVNVPEDG